MADSPGSEGASTARFFADLPRLATPQDAFDRARYRRAPDDWALAATDIVGSTAAVADGRHKTVNFVAAMAIAALKNRCAPRPVPFLFGGDGAVVMVPPEHAAQARIELARVRRTAQAEFGLGLRVGLVGVGELRRFGCEIEVGRYEPSPGNSFGVFAGGGVRRLEAAVRGRGDPALVALASVPDTLDDGEPVDLTGLSCRWDALRSRHGKMVAVIVQGAAEPAAIHAAVLRLAGPGLDARPVRLDTLSTSWPPDGLLLEARARRGRAPLAFALARVLWESLLARLVFARGRPAGAFDPQRYLHEMTTNTDFCRHDDTTCFVIDCPLDRVDAIRAHLAACAAAGQCRYGMDVSDTALLTCLVSSTADSQHVHFVDGGGGGYTNAARTLKAAAAEAT